METCPKCGKATWQQADKDTSSGEDLRDFSCDACGWSETVSHGIALWAAMSGHERPARPPAPDPRDVAFDAIRPSLAQDLRALSAADFVARLGQGHAGALVAAGDALLGEHEHAASTLMALAGGPAVIDLLLILLAPSEAAPLGERAAHAAARIGGRELADGVAQLLFARVDDPAQAVALYRILWSFPACEGVEAFRRHAQARNSFGRLLDASEPYGVQYLQVQIRDARS